MATKKVEKNMDKIKDSFKNINEELTKTSVGILEEVKGKVKSTLDFDFDIKKTVKEVNTFTIDTAEDIVEGTIASSEKWQNLAQKAMQGGFKLLDNQQAMFFDALEEVKNQMNKNKERIQKLNKSQK